MAHESVHQKSDGTSSHASQRTTSLPTEGIPSVRHTTEKAQVAENGHQSLVFTDPVAFRYLEEDPSTEVLETQRTLTGFEIYIVEQWACSRVHPTFIINTYTGDPFHTVAVGVLSVPIDERTWSPRLKVYFNAMSQFHARKRETPLGILMVTNLSSFPSSLTVIAVPDGDVRNHRKDFIVNEDLKRLGCSGRAGLNLKPPFPATEAKFYQLYRTSDQVPFYDAVMELIRLCQMALTVFDKLQPEYVDGLLCDITERAINDWWTDIGTDLYNIEPSDGILGPTTVSALLGTLMGARNRLHAFSAPVPKDAFEPSAFKRGISSFQKSQKLDRTRRLDRQTLDRLHRVTAKAASGEGWTVPRAVKSTVAELGGKGGEMVMGIVGGRDKAGIAEVETLDIERFVQLVHGARSKWLWLGKPRKPGADSFSQDNGEDDLVFMRDDQGGYVWTSRNRDAASDYTSGRPSLEKEPSWKQIELSGTGEDKEAQSKLPPKKSVTGKVSDARTGLGRIRDAVGIPNLRSHHHKQSKDSVELGYNPQTTGAGTGYAPTSDVSQSVQGSEKQVNDHDLSKESGGQFATELVDAHSSPIDKPDLASEEHASEPYDKSLGQPLPGNTRIKNKVVSPDGPEGSSSRPVQSATLVKRFLRHPRSCPHFPSGSSAMPDRRDSYWPRHLSFSAVEDAILGSDNFPDFSPPGSVEDATAAETIFHEDMATSDARMIGDKIGDLTETTASWVEGQIAGVESIEGSVQSQMRELNAIYQDKYEDYNALRANAVAMISKESGNLTENAKKVELLGAKLDYELNAMESRIEEVEVGLGEYERNITQLERRVQNLVQVDEQKSGTSWFRWGLQLLRTRSQGSQ